MYLSSLIKEYTTEALTRIFPPEQDAFDPSQIEITAATQTQFGHYQCNSAMRLGKILGLNPRSLAERWAKDMQDHPLLHQNALVFEKIEVAGPGFINFSFSPKFLADALLGMLKDPRLGIPFAEPSLKIIIDYSSPNVAKEMHVGHLRTTIIGDALAKILDFLGHQILPLNHIGDWGTQFGMLIAHLKVVLPEITDINPPNVHLSDLLQWYRASKHRFDEDPVFKKQAQAEVVALQSGDPLSMRVWEHICTISRRGYQEIYDLLDVHLIERGESFYNFLLPKMIDELAKQQLITDSDGAKCVYLEGFKNREGEALPLILQKSDGGYNYATTDLAALYHRIQVEAADWIIYVVDAGQTQHFQMIFQTAEKAGFLNPDVTRVTHVPFGLVLRTDGKKFKTRAGDTERLIDLLMVAVDKAKALLTERHPEMPEEVLNASAKVLGINAIKYADLACHRTSDYIFSYEKMLRFEGNTAAFLLYAYIRIKSIQRKTFIKVEDLMTANSEITLTHPAEIELALKVCQLREALEKTVNDLAPNHLTDYLHQLAEKFHVFFHYCRVEGTAEQNSRLLLCEAVARVLSLGFKVLGLKPLERM